MSDVLELASDDPESYPPIQLLMLRAFRRIGPIAKKETGSGVTYNFRGVDTVTNAVGPIMRDLGILPTSTVADLRVDYYTTKNGAHMNRTIVTLRWRFTGPRGDYVETETVGESADSADKDATQAHSVSLRIALLQMFIIPTDSPDPDSQREERGAPLDEYQSIGWDSKSAHDKAVKAAADAAKKLPEDAQATVKAWLQENDYGRPYRPEWVRAWTDKAAELAAEPAEDPGYDEAPPKQETLTGD